MIENADSLNKIIRNRRKDAEIKLGYKNFFVRIIVIIAVILLVFTQVFMLAQVHGNEMFPAIKDGDLMLGFRLQSSYQKNDVVVYEQDGETKVGRILAVEVDNVTIDENGYLYVNGTLQEGEILYPTYAKEGVSYPYTVPEGSVFILGDYRTHSVDSRDFGAVSTDDVRAKIITILRRRTL